MGGRKQRSVESKDTIPGSSLSLGENVSKLDATGTGNNEGPNRTYDVERVRSNNSDTTIHRNRADLVFTVAEMESQPPTF